MDEYINKEQAIAMIKALPVADFNGVTMFSKKRVIKALETLVPIHVTTKMRRNYYSQVYCQNCNQIINLSCWEIEHLGHCPHCGLEIEECVF